MTLEEMREACAKVAWKNEAAQSTVDAIRAVPIPAASAAEKYEAERRGVEAAVEAIASRLDHEAAEASRYVGTDNGQTAETWREAAAVVRSFPKLPSVAAVMAETIENHTRRAIENKAAVARLVDSVAAPGYDGQYAAAVIGDDLRRRFATATAPIDDEPPGLLLRAVIRERDEARRERDIARREHAARCRELESMEQVVFDSAAMREQAELTCNVAMGFAFDRAREVQANREFWDGHLRCAYCGVVVATSEIRAHIDDCAKHPIRAVRNERDKAIAERDAARAVLLECSMWFSRWRRDVRITGADAISGWEELELLHNKCAELAKRGGA